MAGKLDDLKKVADSAGITYSENVSLKGLEKIIKKHNDTVSDAQEFNDTLEDLDKSQTEKKPLKPLNSSAFPDELKSEIIWTGKPKRCAGLASMYDNTKENFPIYRTMNGDRADYSKDFLDSKVRAKAMTVKDGIYSAK